jgi:hypothetical protein
MNQVLEEVKAIPGVVGGFIFNSRNGIAANNLPPVFRDAKLMSIGKTASKMYASGKLSFSDVTEISLYYEESVIIVREAADGLFLLMICDPSVNINLLNMSVKLIMDEFKVPAAGDAQAAGKKEAPVQQKKVTVEELMQGGPLADALNGMRAALAKVLGPMAKIIFMDAVNDWLKDNKPSFDTLENLVEALNKEISDPKKIAFYKDQILPYITQKK